MNRRHHGAVAVVGIAVLSLASALGSQKGASADGANAAAKDGKAIFLENRCNSCHTISALGIEKKKAAAEDEDAKDSKKKPPDLSGVGKKHKAAWMVKYLQKLETIDGEKHRKKFKGTDAELAVLTAWLETQKADTKKGTK